MSRAPHPSTNGKITPPARDGLEVRAATTRQPERDLAAPTPFPGPFVTLDEAAERVFAEAMALWQCDACALPPTTSGYRLRIVMDYTYP
jgi:hypothetical protein